MDVSSTSIAPGKTATLTVRVEPEVSEGVVEKTVTVTSNDPSRPIQVIRLKAEIEPDFHASSPIAKGKTIFSEECQSCHADKLEAKSGRDLYQAACVVCHGSFEERDHVRSLDAAKLVADLEHVRRSIAQGSRAMPGFSRSAGGVLDDSQVESLVDLIRKSAPPAKPAPAKPASAKPVTPKAVTPKAAAPKTAPSRPSTPAPKKSQFLPSSSH